MRYFDDRLRGPFQILQGSVLIVPMVLVWLAAYFLLGSEEVAGAWDTRRRL